MQGRTTNRAGRAGRTAMAVLLSMATAGAIAEVTAPSQRYVTPDETRSSAPQWPDQPKAAPGSPNILLVLTDDVGFGASSTFGGAIPTPVYDALAEDGLRYNQFNTAALCSPTRAALLTGQNPHAVAMGHVENMPAGYDGYNSIIPKSSAMIARILRDAGYATAAFGKWHLTPKWEQSQAGPFDRWPTGQGFDHFYGFLASDNSMWNPTLTEDTTFIDVPTGPDYHFDKDMADQTIDWIAEQKTLDPDRPFFAYYAPGTAHTPHHAPKEWVDRFRGQYDMGWDKLRQQIFERQKALGVIPADTVLTPRPAELPAWDSLSTEKKKLFARFMEAYAASLAYMDHQIGRIVQSLKDSGQYDHTLIVFIQGDNGASAEGGLDGRLFQQTLVNGVAEDPTYMTSRIDDIGGPDLYPLYPAGWAWALNSPFRYYKQVASYFGGTRNGLVISWPKGIADKGGVRSQYHFVSDITPTILEIAGIAAPKQVDGVDQTPMDGVSMRYSFTAPQAPSRRHVQYYEMMGSKGIYQDGWFASMRPARQPWDFKSPMPDDLTAQPWELFDVTRDFSQARDLAKSEPRRLREMKELFWAEAGRNKALPILKLGFGAIERPSLGAGRTSFTFPPDIRRVTEDAAPQIIGRSYSVSADVVVPEAGAKGVIIAQGGRFGGWALYAHEGRLTYHYNALDPRQYKAVSSETLTPGPHKLVATFTTDAAKPGSGGAISFSIDGRPAGSGRIEATLPNWISHIEGLDVGADTGTAVSQDYRSEDSAFNGDLSHVTVQLLD